MDQLKFLIADDEESIRKGLRYIIDWDKTGFKYCGEASNGKDAVNQIIDLQPDLVILDIKMPGMTGIEVLQYVGDYFKKKNLEMPSFIILSGFSEFDYAKNAINYGAKAYLLKPVDEDELEKTVLQIKEELLEKKQLQDISKNSKKLQTNQLIEAILQNKSYQTSDIPETEKFFENYDDSSYQSILVDLKYFNSDSVQQLEKTLKNYFSFFTNEIISTNETINILLKTTNQQAVLNCLERTAKNFQQNTFICCGQAYKGLIGLKESFSEADNLRKNLFYISDKAYLTNENVNNDCEEFTTDKINQLIEKLIFCIETYDKNQLKEIENQLYKILCNPKAGESETKKNIIYCLVELRNRITKKYPEREISDGQTFDIVPKVLEKNSFKNCFEYLNIVCNNYIENFNFNTSDSVIVKVIAYIKTNYSQDLKLEVLGDMFNCNSAYLGKKFKKYTGVQFNTYLDNLRIEEAKDKLLNTDLKIYQISKLVGYTNTDYFFMKFKKNTGLTPKEFKSNNGKAEE